MTKERDDLLHILGKCYEFYGKTPSQTHTQIWLETLSPYPVALVANAFKRYYATGQYMPRPVQILGLLDELKARNRGAAPLDQSHGQQTPEIAQAWITYMRFAFGMSIGARALPDAPAMPLEQALEIVNREAAKYDRLDSILPEHRIDSYWRSAAA